MKKVLVAMSGGVDSSVAAYLLKQQGYKVSGATFVLFDGCKEGSVGDAQTVCKHLDVPHMVFSYRDLFRRHVLDYFCQTYRQGRTPNPCVACNIHIKFGAFLKDARRLGFDYISTGHYAQVEYDESAGRYCLRQCVNRKKDQSYVLYHLSQEQLAQLLLPLAHLEKPQVRQIAREAGLPVAEKSDSQDICFVENGKYAQFLEEYTGLVGAPGVFLDERGNVLGEHSGFYHYTLGQRRGLGVALGKRQFVLSLHPETNAVVLGDEDKLFRQSLLLDKVCWQSTAPPQGPIEVLCKLRYAHAPAPCTVTPVSEQRCRLDFYQPQRAATPGQTAVFYREDVVLGGGEIDMLLP